MRYAYYVIDDNYIEYTFPISDKNSSGQITKVTVTPGGALVFQDYLDQPLRAFAPNSWKRFDKVEKTNVQTN